jgi:hypothetical protein
MPIRLLESIAISDNISTDIVNAGYMFRNIDLVHLGCDNHPMMMRLIKREARTVLEELLRRNPHLLDEDIQDYAIPPEAIRGILLDQIWDLTGRSGVNKFLITLEDVINQGLDGQYAKEIDQTIRREEPTESTEPTEEDKELSADRHKRIFKKLKAMFPSIKIYAENQFTYYPTPAEMAERIKAMPKAILMNRKKMPSAKVIWDYSSRLELGPEGKPIQTGRIRPRFVGKNMIDIGVLWTTEDGKTIEIDPTSQSHQKYIDEFQKKLSENLDAWTGVVAVERTPETEAGVGPASEKQMKDTLVSYEDMPDDNKEIIRNEIVNAIEKAGEAKLGKQLEQQFPENKQYKGKMTGINIPVKGQKLAEWGSPQWHEQLPDGDGLGYFVLQQDAEGNMTIYPHVIMAAGQIAQEITGQIAEANQEIESLKAQIKAKEEMAKPSTGPLQRGERIAPLAILPDQLSNAQSKVHGLEQRLKAIQNIPRYVESIPAKESMDALKEMYDLVRLPYLNKLASEISASWHGGITKKESVEKVCEIIKMQAAEEINRRQQQEETIGANEEYEGDIKERYITYELQISQASKARNNLHIYAPESTDSQVDKVIPGGSAVRRNFRNRPEDPDLKKQYETIQIKLFALDFRFASRLIDRDVRNMDYGVREPARFEEGPNGKVGVITIVPPADKDEEKKTFERKSGEQGIEVIIVRRDDIQAKVTTNITDENTRMAEIIVDRINSKNSIQFREHIFNKHNGRFMRVPFPPGSTDIWFGRISPEGIITFYKKFPKEFRGASNFAKFEATYTSMTEGNPTAHCIVTSGLSIDDMYSPDPEEVLKKRLYRLVKAEKDFKADSGISVKRIPGDVDPLECLMDQVNNQTGTSTNPLLRFRKSGTEAREKDIRSEYLWGIYVVDKGAVFNPNTTAPVGATKTEIGDIIPDESKTEEGQKANPPLFGYKNLSEATAALVGNILWLGGDLTTRNPVRGMIIEPQSGMAMIEYQTRDKTKRVILSTYQNKFSFKNVAKLLSEKMPPNFKLEDSINLYKHHEDPTDRTSPLVWNPGGFVKFMTQKLAPTGLSMEQIEEAFRPMIEAIAGNVYRRFNLRDKEQDLKDVTQEAYRIFWRVFETDNKRDVWYDPDPKHDKYYTDIRTDIEGLPMEEDLKKIIRAENSSRDINYYQGAATRALPSLQPLQDTNDQKQNGKVWIYETKTNKKYYFSPDDPKFRVPDPNNPSTLGKPTLDYIKAELSKETGSKDEEELDYLTKLVYAKMKPAEEVYGGWTVYTSDKFSRQGGKLGIVIALPTNNPDASPELVNRSIDTLANYIASNSDIATPEFDADVADMRKRMVKKDPDFARYAARTLRLELTKRFMSGSGRFRFTTHTAGGTWQTYMTTAPIARYDVYVFEFVSIPNGVKYMSNGSTVDSTGTVPTEYVRAAIESYARGDHFDLISGGEEVTTELKLMGGLDVEVFQFRNDMESTEDRFGSSYRDRFPEVNKFIRNVLMQYASQESKQSDKKQLNLKNSTKQRLSDLWNTTKKKNTQETKALSSDIGALSLKKYLDKAVYVRIIPIGRLVSSDGTQDDRETSIFAGAKTSVATPDNIAAVREQIEVILNNSGLTDEQIELLRLRFNLDDDQGLMGFFRSLTDGKQNQEYEWFDKETNLTFKADHNLWADKSTGLEFRIPMGIEDDINLAHYIENTLNFTTVASNVKELMTKLHEKGIVEPQKVIDGIKIIKPDLNAQWVSKLVQLISKNQLKDIGEIADSLRMVGPAKPSSEEVSEALQKKKFEYGGWQCQYESEMFQIKLPPGISPTDEKGRKAVKAKLKEIATGSLTLAGKDRVAKGIPVYSFINSVVNDAKKAATIKPSGDWLRLFDAELDRGIEALTNKIVPLLEPAMKRTNPEVQGDSNSDVVDDVLKQDINGVLTRLKIQVVSGTPKDKTTTAAFSQEDLAKAEYSKNRAIELMKSDPQNKDKWDGMRKNIDSTIKAIKSGKALYDSITGMYFASRDVEQIAQTIINFPKFVTYDNPYFGIKFWNLDNEEIRNTILTSMKVGNNVTTTRMAELWIRKEKKRGVDAGAEDIDKYKEALAKLGATNIQDKKFQELLNDATASIMAAPWKDKAEGEDNYIEATVTTKADGLDKAERVAIGSQEDLNRNILRMANGISSRLHSHHFNVNQKGRITQEYADTLVAQLREIGNASTSAVTQIMDIRQDKVMVDSLNNMLRGEDEFQNPVGLKLANIDAQISKILTNYDTESEIKDGFKTLFKTSDDNQAYNMAYKIFNVYTQKKYGGGIGGGSARDKLWSKVNNDELNTSAGLVDAETSVGIQDVEKEIPYVYKTGSIFNIAKEVMTPSTAAKFEAEKQKKLDIAMGRAQNPEIPKSIKVESFEVDLAPDGI